VKPARRQPVSPLLLGLCGQEWRSLPAARRPGRYPQPGHSAPEVEACLSPWEETCLCLLPGRWMVEHKPVYNGNPAWRKGRISGERVFQRICMANTGVTTPRFVLATGAC